jgi:hypothetical protein
MQPTHRQTRHAVVGSGAIALALLALPLMVGLVYFERDTAALGVCAYEALRQVLAGPGGWLSSTLGNGVSLAAYPDSHAYYPLAWPLLLVDAEHAYSWMIVLHLSVGAAATAALARSFGVRRSLSLAAGVAFAFSGPVLDLVTHAQFVVIAAWLPLGWWAARRAARSRYEHGALWLAAAIAGTLLGGEPQSAGTLVGLAALEHLAATTRAGSRRRIAWRDALRASVAALATIVGGLAVGLVAWWEQFAQGPLSTRAGGIALEDAQRWALDGAGAVAALLPDASRWSKAVMVWNDRPYLGAFVVFTAMVGMTVARARTAIIAAVVSTLLALGASTPLYAFAWRFVPAFDHFRYPAKYLVPASLALVVLAAIALEQAHRQRRTRTRLCVTWTIGVLVVALLAARLAPGAKPDVLASAIVPLLAAVAAIATQRRLLATVLAGSMLVVAPTLVKADDPVTPLGSILAGVAREERQKGHVRPVICSAYALLERSIHIEGSSVDLAVVTIVGWRAWLQLDTPVLDGVANAIPYSATARSAVALQLESHVTPQDVRAARALGCTHVIGELPNGPGAVLVDAATALGPGASFPNNVPVRPFVIDDPVPPVFVARQPTFTPTSDVADRLREAPTAADVVAVIDDPLPGGAPPQLPSGDDVTLLASSWDRRDRATLSLRGSGGAVVGLRTLFLPGWRARQAGVALRVVRASGGFPAAIVDDVTRGPVEMFYEPVHTTRSVASLLGGLLLLSGVVAAGARRRRARRRALPAA